MQEGETCSGRYEQLALDREPYLKRARESAKYTIPSLMPEEGQGAHDTLYQPYQSIGARGLNTLASKLLMSLLPPNSPFFRLQIDDYTEEQLVQDEEQTAKINGELGRIERVIMADIEAMGFRSPAFEVFKQLIACGDVQLFLPKKGKPRVYTLDQYVNIRDPRGQLLESILKEEVSKKALSEEELALVSDSTANSDKGAKHDHVDVYTKYWLEDGYYHSYQEIEGQIVPNSDGKWKEDEGPLMSLRWTALDGEHYGRSYVEEYLGDLMALEGLSQAILEGAAASSKIVFFVEPNGTTRIKDVTDAENLDVKAGNAEDVSVLQVEKLGDMSVAQQLMGEIMERIMSAFLMQSSVQRDAERVTAEEIRLVASELEDVLGGVYSVLAQDFQLPLVNREMAKLQRTKKLPKLPEGIVQPVIVTGLEALGRASDLQKYRTAFGILAEMIPPEELMIRLKPSSIITNVFTSLSIDTEGMLRSDEEVEKIKEQQRQQQMQQMMQETLASMGEKATPEATKAVMQQATGNNKG